MRSRSDTGGQGTNTRNRLQNNHLLVLFAQRRQSFVNMVDVFLQPVNAGELLQNALCEHTRQLCHCPHQLFLGSLQQDTMPFRQGDAELIEQPPHGVGLHDAHFHQLGAHRCKTKHACCCLLLMGTSCKCCWAGSSLTTWPGAFNNRPQWCEPPHASSAISDGWRLAVGGWRLAKNAETRTRLSLMR